MELNTEVFNLYTTVIVSGISAGFALGFIAWGIGFGINGIIKLFKMA